MDRATVGLLVDALWDQSWDVRIAALRALTRLSLDSSLWKEIGEQALSALAPASEGGAPAARRLECIAQAARIPEWAVRLRVRELQQSGDVEESQAAAWALVNVRDCAAVPFLVRLIAAVPGKPDYERQSYARRLATLDVSVDSSAVRRLAIFDSDENVRFWSAVALARSGDTAILTDLLTSVRRGDLDVSSPVWSWEIRELLPTLLSDSIDQEALRELSPDHRQRPPYSEEAQEDRLSVYELEEEISNHWWAIAELRDIWPPDYGRMESPQDLAELTAEDTPAETGALVSSLFEILIERAGDETWRIVTCGNAIASFADALDGRLSADLPRLFESYSVVFDAYINLDDPWPTLRSQIAWVASRAPLRDIVLEAVWRLSATEERARLIAARFVEEAVRYRRQSDAPLFGGGLEPPDVDPPAIEPYAPMAIAIGHPAESGSDVRFHVSLPRRVPEDGEAMAQLDPKAYKKALKRAAKKAARLRAVAAPGFRLERDLVDCTVFAPAEPVRGRFVLVQAYLHAPAQSTSAAALAEEFDVNTSRRGVRGLEVPIPTGTLVDVELEIPGLRVLDSLQRVAWLGRAEAASFSVWIPPEHPGGPTPGLVVIRRDGVPVGRVRFQITVQSKPRRWPHAHRFCDGDDSIRFRSAFISYASADRGEVLPRAQVLTAAGVSYFQDVLDLDPGERWRLEIYKRIDECDLFLLFWSKAAKESKWVRREAKRALER